MSTKHTPGPLFVKQPDQWPFNILTVDAAGNEVFWERRHAYGTDQLTAAQVMAGSCFSNPETRAAAIESNGRQVADAYLRAAAPELLAVLVSMNHMGGDDRGGYCICPLNDGSAPHHKHATVCVDARAAIAKATGVAP